MLPFQRLKRIGTNIEPWGTPAELLRLVIQFHHIYSACTLLERYNFIQEMALFGKIKQGLITEHHVLDLKRKFQQNPACLILKKNRKLFQLNRVFENHTGLGVEVQLKH